jgi:hypothetical protein
MIEELTGGIAATEERSPRCCPTGQARACPRHSSMPSPHSPAAVDPFEVGRMYEVARRSTLGCV